MKREFLLWSVLAVILGGLIYVLFRSDSLLMFRWFSELSLLSPIQEIRGFTLSFKHILPGWFIFSLPDGLWVFSFVCIFLYIWNCEINRQNFLWVIIIPLIGYVSELGQIFKIVPGIFDIADLAFYILGFFLPIIIFNKSITIKYKKI